MTCDSSMSALRPHNVQSREQEHLGRQKQNKTKQNKQNWNSTLFPYRDSFLSSYRRTRIRKGMLRTTAYQCSRLVLLCDGTSQLHTLQRAAAMSNKMSYPSSPPTRDKNGVSIVKFLSFFIYLCERLLSTSSRDEPWALHNGNYSTNPCVCALVICDCRFTQHVLNIHWRGYSAVQLLHGYCRKKLLLSG